MWLDVFISMSVITLERLMLIRTLITVFDYFTKSRARWFCSLAGMISDWPSPAVHVDAISVLLCFGRCCSEVPSRLKWPKRENIQKRYRFSLFSEARGSKAIFNLMKKSSQLTCTIHNMQFPIVLARWISTVNKQARPSILHVNLT